MVTSTIARSQYVVSHRDAASSCLRVSSAMTISCRGQWCFQGHVNAGQMAKNHCGPCRPNEAGAMFESEPPPDSTPANNRTGGFSTMRVAAKPRRAGSQGDSAPATRTFSMALDYFREWDGALTRALISEDTDAKPPFASSTLTMCGSFCQRISVPMDTPTPRAASYARCRAPEDGHPVRGVQWRNLRHNGFGSWPTCARETISAAWRNAMKVLSQRDGKLELWLAPPSSTRTRGDLIQRRCRRLESRT